jgi:hypothetical protein
MATLTKADAARQLRISRTTLYKLIDQGTLSPTADGLIDTAELGRVLSTLHVHRARPRTHMDTAQMDAYPSRDAHHERPVHTPREHREQPSSERQLTSSYRDLVDILREQLQAAQERERDYRAHIARLTIMLDQAHQQNQRLLDLPRAAPQGPPQAPPGTTPAPSRGPRRRGARPGTPPRQPGTSAADARGDMRRRIVALLQDHPEGLTPAEMRTLLGIERSLVDTCQGMLRYGLVQRVGRGRYVARDPQQA